MAMMNCKNVRNFGISTKFATRLLSQGLLKKKANYLKSWERIPGPPYLPLIGPVLNFLPGGIFYKMSGLEIFEKLQEKYGPIIKLKGMLGKPDVVFLFDSETSAQVLRAEDWLPDRPGFQVLIHYRKKYKCEKKGTLPNKTGLFSDSGNEWKLIRSTVNQIMLQPKTVNLYETVISEVVLDMIERLKQKRDEQHMISTDFGQEMHLWCLESIAVVALGTRLNCVNYDLPEDSPAVKLINCVREIFDVSSELEIKPSFWMYYPTKTFQRAKQLFEQQEE